MRICMYLMVHVLSSLITSSNVSRKIVSVAHSRRRKRSGRRSDEDGLYFSILFFILKLFCKASSLLSLFSFTALYYHYCKYIYILKLILTSKCVSLSVHHFRLSRCSGICFLCCISCLATLRLSRGN